MVLSHRTPVNQVWWLERGIFLRSMYFFSFLSFKLYTQRLVFKDWFQIPSSCRVHITSVEFQFGFLWRTVDSGKLPRLTFLQGEKPENQWRTRGQLYCLQELCEVYMAAVAGQLGECWEKEGHLHDTIVLAVYMKKKPISPWGILVQKVSSEQGGNWASACQFFPCSVPSAPLPKLPCIQLLSSGSSHQLLRVQLQQSCTAPVHLCSSPTVPLTRISFLSFPMSQISTREKSPLWPTKAEQSLKHSHGLVSCYF